MAYDTYESELLLEIGNWKCEWNHSITDTFPYYTECAAAIRFLLLIIYVPTFLQAGLLVICMYNVFTLSIGNASRVTLKAHRKISRAFMVNLIIIGIKALDAIIQYNGYVVIWMSMYNYINEWPKETYDLYNIVYDLAELFSYTAYTVHGFLVVWLLSRILLKTSTAPSCQTSTISIVNLSTVSRN